MNRSQKIGVEWNFTLVELLVVIAIVAILSSLLLPALGGRTTEFIPGKFHYESHADTILRSGFNESSRGRVA